MKYSCRIMLTLAAMVAGLWTETAAGQATREWSRVFGSPTDEKALALTLGPGGNVFVAGNAFGAFYGQSSTQESAFVVGFAPDGSTNWARIFGSSTNDAAKDILYDALSGNLVVAGSTEGAWGGSVNQGLQDYFVQRMSNNGDFGSTYIRGTTANDTGSGVAMDPGGLFYVSGTTLDKQLVNGSYTNQGAADIFVCKHLPNGTFSGGALWGTVESENSTAVVMGPSNALAMCGSTYAPITMDEIVLGRYDATTMSEQWVLTWGSSGNDQAYDLAFDSQANLYVVGTTEGNLDGFNQGFYDCFLAKYDSAGNQLWVRQWGTPSFDEAYGVTVDALDNIYVVGSMGGAYGAETNAGWSDFFLMQWDSAGTELWVRMWGTASSDYAEDVVVAGTNIYVCGYTWGPFLDDQVNADLSELTSDAVLTKWVMGTNAPPPNGTLVVDVSPEGAGWSMVQYPVNYVGPFSGIGDTAPTPVEPGLYEVAFAPLAGWDTPFPAIVTVLPGGSEVAMGVYTRQYGYITVDVSPDDAPWRFTSYPPDFTFPISGVGDAFWFWAPTGDYTLTCLPYTGYSAPAPAGGTVLPYQLLEFQMIYTPDASASDSDTDGLSDTDETTYGTDPFNPDTDGDGELDGSEVFAGSNPLDPYSIPRGRLTILEPAGYPAKSGKPFRIYWQGDTPLGLASIRLYQGTNWWLLAENLDASASSVLVEGVLPRDIPYNEWSRIHVAGEGAVYEFGNSEWFLLIPDTLYDYSGDGRADIAVYFPPWGMWYIWDGSLFSTFQFGWNGPYPVPADYDGDGITDEAVYYPPTAVWYFYLSQVGFVRAQFGTADTVPVNGDYDGDGLADMAVYHENAGRWFIYSLRGYTILWDADWGSPGYQALGGDYDGDGISDLALYHEASGTWYVKTIDGTTLLWGEAWGGPGWTPVPGDYDGDGDTDLAVYDIVSGRWSFHPSSGLAPFEFGGVGSMPVQADYDGDWVTDPAVFYGPAGMWYLSQSRDGFAAVQFGWYASNPAQPGFRR